MSFKKLAIKYHQAVSNYDIQTIKQLTNIDYIQHNPYVATGQNAFINLIPKLKAFNSKIENYRILDDGQYVIMHHLWHNATPMGADKLVAFHIIRFDKNNKIAEHWNVSTPLADSNNLRQINGQREVDINNQNQTYKIKIIDLVDCLINSEFSLSTLEMFFDKNLIQHHFDIQDGICSLQKYHAENIKISRLHKVFGEGQFVLSISEGFLNQNQTIFYDLYKFENNLIVEHWNVYQTIPHENLANNNTMFGFP